uniref:SDR family NAD(P)-dependent oxidoreductase n=1 Tax=Maribacter sp. TaxID=1897614 RepID=UPI0025BD552C
MKKNILIIGASSGIGNSIVEKTKKDYNIYVANRTSANLNLKEVTYISFDATKDVLDDLLIPDIIHGLIYCPGSINLKPFKMLQIEAIRQDMEINFFSMVNVISSIIPKMTEKASILM